MLCSMTDWPGLSLPPDLDTTLSAGEIIELVELRNKIGQEMLLESNVRNIIIYSHLCYMSNFEITEINNNCNDCLMS